MPEPSGTLEFIGASLGRILASIEERFSEGQVLLLFAELGMQFPSELETKPAFMNALQKAALSSGLLSGALISLTNAIQDGDIRAILSRRLELFNLIRDMLIHIEDVATELINVSGTLPGENPGEVTAFADELQTRLLDYLVIRNIEAVQGLADILEFIGAIERQGVNSPEFEFTKRELNLDDFIQFLQSPGEQLKALYGWGASDFDGLFLLQKLEKLLVSNGFPAILITSGPIPVLDAVFGEISAKTDINPKGLLIKINEPIGIENAAPITRDNWTLESIFNEQLTPNVQIILQPDGYVTFHPPSGDMHGVSEIIWTGGRQDGESYILLGEVGGSRIEVRQFIARAGVDFIWSSASGMAKGAFQVRGEVKGGRVVIDFSQSDSFVKEILSSVSLESEFDLGLGFSSQNGIYFIGSSALEIQLPFHFNLGTVELKALNFRVSIQERKFPITVSANIEANLGPFTAVIDQVGMRADMSLPRDRKGNIGPVDLVFSFLPPQGVRLTIDGVGFTGGGFLRYIEEDQHYEGVLELEFQDRISLKAIGLITTRLPDGSAGFSLLIVITAEFNPPFELGLGFKLSAVGGLLGLNRTANAERLRSGLRDKTLESVLFPQNVIENADRILGDLRQVFPPKADRFIFGPMARITWGTPPLLTIDLGLLIEIPDPVRVLILGVIRALLPDEKAKLLQLHVNFLGVIDFEEQRFALDASLYDSKLLSYTLSGDMAVRLNWGAEPNFLLTVGGFHPAYQPPPLNLPTLRRLSLQLTDGDNPRITLETYFAITSNTVQFGAKAELLAKAGPFSIYGFLSFDVLFQFNPFYFIASISAKVALRAGSSEIASISLDFTLEGPTPWHAKGAAKLKICWFLTIKVRFDKTFGEERDTRLDDVPVLPLLKAAFKDPGNWEARSPGNRHLLVTLKKIQEEGKQVVVYPFGVLTIQQRVVPLGIKIEKFGNQRPADGDSFTIDVFAGEGDEVEELVTDAVQELFAPAQFFELSDAQKLASKSFERYDSGVKMVDSRAFDGDYAIRREVTYELHYIDEQRNLVKQPDSLRPECLAFNHWALRGAIANSPLSHARNRKSALAPGTVQVSQEAYAVVNARDLSLAEEGARATSEARAQRRMEEMIRRNPALDGEILVVPAFEVNGHE